MLSVVVIFAYLLGFTVLVLDLSYIAVDPACVWLAAPICGPPQHPLGYADAGSFGGDHGR